MRKKSIPLSLSMIVIASLTASCADKPETATGNLCVALHPIQGWRREEFQTMSTEHIVQIKEQNCKIEMSCGFPVEAGCTGDLAAGSK
jgi:hypothetical protein